MATSDMCPPPVSSSLLPVSQCQPSLQGPGHLGGKSSLHLGKCIIVVFKILAPRHLSGPEVSGSLLSGHQILHSVQKWVMALLLRDLGKWMMLVFSILEARHLSGPEVSGSLLSGTQIPHSVQKWVMAVMDDCSL